MGNLQNGIELSLKGGGWFPALNLVREAYHPMDRYVGPDMTTWTPVFRFGHILLVPTRLNASKPMLFTVDTGAFDNILMTQAARSAAKVQES